MVGRGRAPCCDKTKVKRGPWSPAEDLRLITCIQKYGHSNWRALPQQAGLLRCGKSCRLRWINYLRPDVKRGNFSREEEETIIRLQKSMGNKWSKIASQLPGRTDNEIKNVWNTHLKKRLGGNDATRDENQSKDSSTSYSSSSPSSSSCISYGDLNLDKGPGIQEAQASVAGETDDQGQDGRFSAAIMQAQWEPIDELKEDSISPGHSNIASDVQSPTSIVELWRPMEETTSLPDRNAPSQVQNLMTTEAKQGMVTDENIEIPLDSDVDIWSMLDSFSPIQTSEFLAQEPEVSTPQSTNFGGEAEYKKWLKYLENELGLAGGTDKDCPQKAADEELVMKTSDNELMFRSQISPATSNFPIWPSPTQDFGI